jgi:alkylation response protein AidB-like acyl-CoA dehydrogenase
MDFGLSEEQALFSDSLRRYLRESVPVTRAREIAQEAAGLDAGTWSELAELGALGVLVPEEHGGTGGTLLDAALVAEVFGGAVLPAPFLSTCVMAPIALLTSGTRDQKHRFLPEIAAGRTHFGVAFGELVSRREGEGVRLEGGRLHGRARIAIDAGVADWFLVAAGPRRLCLVARDAGGLELEPLSTIDVTRRVADLVFDGVEPTDQLGGARGSGAALMRAVDAGRVVLAADTLGASQEMLDRAVEYAKQRKQFGRVIGSFQAVKHMCAEMAAEIEPARSLVWYAAHAFDAEPEESRLVATLTKAHLSEVGTEIAKTATEVHGGIGFTDEHDLHLWFKRIGLNRQLLGGPELLRALAARLQGWDAEPGAGPEDVESPHL